MRFARLPALFITLVAPPLVADAEPRTPRRPQIGVVFSTASVSLSRSYNMSAETWLTQPSVKAFLEGMEELHWVKDRDFVLDVRPIENFAHAQNVIASLVARPADVLLFLTCDWEFHLAHRTTHRIPVVVGPCADDLVGKGVVASLAQPGGQHHRNLRADPRVVRTAALPAEGGRAKPVSRDRPLESGSAGLRLGLARAPRRGWR